jgi:hypothetical protein
MNFEQGIWVEHEQTPEHREYVSVLEKKLNEYVQKGRLPEDVALAILQKQEVTPRNFNSKEEARHAADFLFEMKIMPIIYEFDEFFSYETNLATLQGFLLLNEDELEEKFDANSYEKLLKIQKYLKVLDDYAQGVEQKREQIREDLHP